MNEAKIYKLHEESFITVNRKDGSAKIIKLTDDNYYFQLTLIASEVVQGIDGKKSFGTILENVTAAYDARHADEIRTKANELVAQLIQEQLIVELT